MKLFILLITVFHLNLYAQSNSDQLDIENELELEFSDDLDFSDEPATAIQLEKSETGEPELDFENTESANIETQPDIEDSESADLEDELNIEGSESENLEAELEDSEPVNLEDEFETSDSPELEASEPVQDQPEIEGDIANSIEEDEFSNDSVDQDIAENIENDTPQNKKINPYVGKITPYQKTRRMIDHPFASKGLYKITKDLEYLYRTQQSPQDNNASLRFGLYDPSNLQTEDGLFYFDELYEETRAPLILFDWEWQFKFLGRLSFKAGTGMYFARGNGRFNSATATPDLEPLEDFSLFMLPNSASVVYKFQFWDNQFLIPYADAGVNAFSLMEFQEGESIPKLGVSFGGHFSFGLALNINFIDPWAIMELDRDHGINSVYIIAELRNYFHISGNYDFSGSFVNGGFAFDF